MDGSSAWKWPEGQPPIENALFTLLAYHRGMMQSWGVSRFNGHISTLGATLERAGVLLACVAASIAVSETAVMPAPRATGQLDQIAVVRALVAATAVAALALLILVLL